MGSYDQVPKDEKKMNGEEKEEVKYDLSKEKAVDDLPEKGEKKTVKREHWSNKMDFILSCLGWAVGLGNVWRFPYLCYRNGGGAFLVPYFLMLALSGLPLFLMELGLGQFASRGVIQIWCMAPAFKGIGLAMCMINSLVNVYYPVIIAYIFYYFFVSFARELPWKYCNAPWASDNCTDARLLAVNETYNETYADVDEWSMTTTYDSTMNITDNSTVDEYITRPAQEFWEYVARFLVSLDLTSGAWMCVRKRGRFEAVSTIPRGARRRSLPQTPGSLITLEGKKVTGTRVNLSMMLANECSRLVNPQACIFLVGHLVVDSSTDIVEFEHFISLYVYCLSRKVRT